MEILYLLMPLSVLILIAAAVFFLRAVDQGQFDDLDTPALEILKDDHFLKDDD